MSEKRFKSTIDEDTMSIMPFLVSDNEEEAFYNLQGCVDLLNEQQSTINKLNDENNLLQEVLTENEKMLGKDLDMLTKLRKENKKKDIEIESLNAHITNWLNETKIAKLYQNEQYKTENLEKENEQLKRELQGVAGLLKSYRETIKHNAELLADATRKGYLPPLNDFVKG